MRERGQILRDKIKPDLEAMESVLAPRLGRFGGDFKVQASDGLTRKTELPWVRF